MIVTMTELYLLHTFTDLYLKHKSLKITLGVNEIFPAKFSNKLYATSTAPLSEVKVNRT